MDGPVDLSVCMIVRNEAHQIEAALKNFRLFADEIVVVDTGSTDETRHIAQKYAHVVADYPWHDDFSAARNASLDKARGRYVLWLDADDRVDPDNVEKIRHLKTLLDGRAYCFVLKDIRYGKPFVSFLQIRCVPNHPKVRFQGIVHERLDHALEELGIALVNTDIVIEHHGYTNEYTLKSKIRRNLGLLRKIRETCPESLKDETINYYLAASHHILGDYGEAITCMSACLEILRKKKFFGSEFQREALDPFIWDALLFCAETSVDQNRPREAERYLAQLKIFSSLHPYVLFRVGKLLQRLNRHEEALGFFRRVDLSQQRLTRLPWPKLDPSVILCHQAYSLYHLRGLKTCTQWVLGIEGELTRFQVWEQLGIIAVENEQWELASEAFHRDWEEYRLSTLGWTRYGSLLKREGKLSLAVRLFEKALVEDSNNVEAAIKLANAYWQIGIEQKALKMFAFLIAKGVDDPPVVRAYQILHERLGHR